MGFPRNRTANQPRTPTQGQLLISGIGAGERGQFRKRPAILTSARAELGKVGGCALCLPGLATCVILLMKEERPSLCVWAAGAPSSARSSHHPVFPCGRGGVVGATTRGSFWKRLRVVLGISTKGMLRGLRCWCPLLTQPFKSLGSLSASAVPRVLGQVLP